MKKYLCLLIALLLLLSACGRKAESKPADASPADVPASQDPAPEEDTPSEPVQNEVKEPEPVHPYAWLGLEGMPACNYLDIISTNRYYEVYDLYEAGGTAEVIDAADGIDALQERDGVKSLTVGGWVYSIDENAKTYRVDDMSQLAAQAKASMDYAMENGVNMTGRQFNDTGASAVPLLPDDGAEYEYYEFVTSNPGVNEITERFFLKDGDVYAVYTLTRQGERTEERTKRIRSVTADVPAGTFDVPELSQYTRVN